jgi:hypothetical protein
MKRFIVLGVAGASLLIATSIVTTNKSQKVFATENHFYQKSSTAESKIKDKVLFAAISKELLKEIGPNSEMSEENLAKISHLTITGDEARKIDSLEGIDLLKGLTQFTFNNSELSDFSILSSNQMLKKLNLRENNISDISFLTKLVKIENLDLSMNPLSQINSIKSLNALKTLSLEQSYGEQDLQVLSGLKNLTKLSIPGNHVTSLKGIEGLGLLDRLDLDNNQLGDIHLIKRHAKDYSAKNQTVKPDMINLKSRDVKLKVAQKDIDNSRVTVTKIFDKGIYSAEEGAIHWILKNDTGRLRYQWQSNDKQFTGSFSQNYKISDQVKQGKVTIHFIDNHQHSILENQVKVGEIGGKYEIDAPAIEGYHLTSKEHHMEGIFDGSNQNITFVYTKDEVSQLSLIKVHYQDEFGNKINEDTTVPVGSDGSYNIEQRYIYGYDFVKANQKLNGTASKDLQDITLTYAIKYKGKDIDVRFVTESGQLLETPEDLQGKLNQPFTITAKTFPGYTLKKGQKNVITGIFSNHEQRYVFTYDKN